MNKFLILMLITTLGVNVSAQEISPYAKYKINESVSAEIQNINRVEKYGWDNLEISYRLKNESNFDLYKVDLTVYLIDKKDNQVGLIEIHNFKIPKNSDAEYKFTEIHPEFVNDNFEKIIVVKNNIEVLVENDEQSGMAKIQCLPALSYK